MTCYVCSLTLSGITFLSLLLLSPHTKRTLLRATLELFVHTHVEGIQVSTPAHHRCRHMLACSDHIHMVGSCTTCVSSNSDIKHAACTGVLQERDPRGRGSLEQKDSGSARICIAPVQSDKVTQAHARRVQRRRFRLAYAYQSHMAK